MYAICFVWPSSSHALISPFVAAIGSARYGDALRFADDVTMRRTGASSRFHPADERRELRLLLTAFLRQREQRAASIRRTTAGSFVCASRRSSGSGNSSSVDG